MKFILQIFAILLTCFEMLCGTGTSLGRDNLFALRAKRKVRDFLLVELGAAERAIFFTIADTIFRDPDDVNKSNQFIALRIAVVAASLRNRRGYYLFDHNNPRDLLKLRQLPESILLELLTAACSMSGLEFLIPPDSSAPVATEPDQATTVAAKQETAVNPS